MRKIDYVRTGENLKKARVERGLSLRKAAKAMFISHDALFRYERGQRRIPPDVLNAAAEMYKVDREVVTVYREEEA